MATLQDVEIFCEALESGKFSKGLGRLYNSVHNSFCCLGVFEHAVMGMPLKYIEKRCGLNSNSVVHFHSSLGAHKAGKPNKKLSELNDGTIYSTKPKSFKEIAEIIRANPHDYLVIDGNTAYNSYKEKV